MYLPYSPGELAAWAMKPFWGLHENLLPEPDVLEGSLEAVILLVAHAFRLGLTLSVALQTNLVVQLANLNFEFLI